MSPEGALPNDRRHEGRPDEELRRIRSVRLGICERRSEYSRRIGPTMLPQPNQRTSS